MFPIKIRKHALIILIRRVKTTQIYTDIKPRIEEKNLQSILLAPSVDRHLIKEQTDFRPGKSYCKQLLNLTQHIEDGYQRGMITGAAFVDLSAAYDTVNHRLLIRKLYDFTEDSPLCRVIQNMLSSRRFYVELNNDRSRWRNQKNGLPQGSVLSPVLLLLSCHQTAFFHLSTHFLAFSLNF